MSKSDPKTDAAAPAMPPAFVPTHGGVYRVGKSGAVSVLAGGPPKDETPAPADQLPKEGAA